MPVKNIRRGTAADIGQVNSAKSNLIYVDSATDVLKFGAAASGTTAKEVMDISSTQIVSGKLRPVRVAADDSAITVVPGVVILNKAGVGAYTIVAPTAAQEGTEIVFINNTANAHVITGTNLFHAGETGGPFNKLTFAAFLGSACTIVAYNLLWVVTSDQIVTVGD